MPPLPTAGDIVDGAKLKKLVDDEAEFTKFINAEFDELDEDKNGTLSVAELRQAILKVAQLLGLPPPGTKAEADKLVDDIFTSFYSKNTSDEVDRETFAGVSREILSEIAQGLQDEPLMVEAIDGSGLRSILESDNFLELALDVFDSLDADKSGELDRDELRTAVHHLGLDQGLPAAGSRPAADAIVDDMLQKYAHGEQKVMKREEFVELLRAVLEGVVEALEAQPLVVAHDVKVLTGAPIRKLLENEDEFKKVAVEMFDEWDSDSDGSLSKAEVATGFQQLGLAFGLPPPASKEEAEKLFTAVFDAADFDHSGSVDLGEFTELIRALFEGIASELEANPIVIDSTVVAAI
eukprot:TRINITY_DN17960_c0_g5_i1.p1 TRINITY_DN17960_c0_g5~~TRINITY_DN17960_c0_g5_i1.p1  ORF type:complete len:351 (+),score=95.49 TRINITY_DN17960_c0_g5_i1:192-1244(+)